MKKLFVVLAILFVGILLAGCTSQPAEPAVTTVVPTAEPTVVATPVPTAEPTKEVVVVVVTPTPTATATPAPIPTHVITFTQDLTIDPSATAYVKVGTKVIWKNDDPFKPHSIDANDIQLDRYFGTDDAVQIPYGGSIEVIFDKVGSYDYTTGPFQPQVQAKIIVIE